MKPCSRRSTGPRRSDGSAASRERETPEGYAVEFAVLDDAAMAFLDSRPRDFALIG